MTHKLVPPGRARVLVTNDDGINAPGIKILQKALRGLAKEVWVVAPETEQSATAHSLTLRRPLRIRHVSGRRYAVDGTPTDCVLLAINQIMRDKRPDLVVSGINDGGNLGDDVTYSGTVAAAIEAVILGVPAIAFSQQSVDGETPHWGTAEHWVPRVLRKIAGLEVPKDTIINVNFPNVARADVSGIEIARQGARKIGDQVQEGHDPKGVPYYWIGGQRMEERFRRGTDLEVVSRGAVSVTPLSVDLTNRGFLKKLKAVFP